MADLESDSLMNEEDSDDSQQDTENGIDESGDGAHVEDEEQEDADLADETADLALVTDHNYKHLVSSGVKKRVARELVKLINDDKLSLEDIDKRVTRGLRAFRVEDGIQLVHRLSQFDLSYVTQKSSFICGQMSILKLQLRRSKGELTSLTPVKGPDPDKLKALLERTGYTLSLSKSMRKYGGPPPAWEGEAPGAGHTVYIGELPEDMYEDELVPIFEQFGSIYELHIMTDPISYASRGHCFLTYYTTEQANLAIEKLNNFEIRDGATLKANISIPNVTLFLGGLSSKKTRQQYKEEFTRQTDGVVEFDLLVCDQLPEGVKNIPVAGLLTYLNHDLSHKARLALNAGKISIFGEKVHAACADIRGMTDPEKFAKATLIHVHQMKPNTTVDWLRNKFESYGKVLKVDVLEHHAFVTYEDSLTALKVMSALKGQWRQASTLYNAGIVGSPYEYLTKEVGGVLIDVSLGFVWSQRKPRRGRSVKRGAQSQRGGFLSLRGRPPLLRGKGGPHHGLLPPPYPLHPPFFRGRYPTPPPPEDLMVYENFNMRREYPPFPEFGFGPRPRFGPGFGHDFDSYGPPPPPPPMLRRGHGGPPVPVPLMGIDPMGGHWRPGPWRSHGSPPSAPPRYTNKRKSGGGPVNRGKKKRTNMNS